MKKILLALFIVSVIVIAGCSSGTQDNVDSNREKITVFKSPTCGCCVGYAAELEKAGYDVETVSMTDMAAIKLKHNIPRSMESCHTAIVGDYFVEGHVPIYVVNKLLNEKPQIDGIALPGMPAGSPGMPGIKRGDFVIYGLSNGNIEEYTRG
jgi:hypothetical protein